MRIEMGMTAKEAAPLLDKARKQKATSESEYNEALAASGNFTPAENMYENVTKGTEAMAPAEWKDVVARIIEKIIVHEDKTVEILAKIGS